MPTAPGDTISVAIADDEALIRGGLRSMLEGEPDLVVVGEAPSGRDALELVRLKRPDVVLMDLRMPGMDGIAATARIVADGLPTRVLVVTTFDLDEHVFAALRAGAAGFLLKDTDPDRLAGAVRTVAGGEALFAPPVTRRLVEHYVARPSPDEELTARLAELTEREREVLLLVARGLSNAEIAAEAFLSEGTVKTHLTRVLAKLGLRSRTQAVVLAYECGLVRAGRGTRAAG
ncbi:response regulator transcription factor [Patulibacter sp. NPDC049589]|uniref:response regulator transcription factor n=1 Tax=Patulibacter sp. NPDC049589 TaxID=3154731 RepID=UPI00343F6F98